MEHFHITYKPWAGSEMALHGEDLLQKLLLCNKEFQGLLIDVHFPNVISIHFPNMTKTFSGSKFFIRIIDSVS